MRFVKGFLLDIEKTKKVMLPMFIILMIINGCFGFPFNIKEPDFSYPIVIAIMSAAYFKGKVIRTFLINFFCVGVGLLFGFFIEYGEVSIENNYTVFNILIFLVVIPIITVFCSFLITVVTGLNKMK